MPELKNAKHERFAQCIVLGQEQAKAYANAGYKKAKSNYSTASRLLSHANVKARIRELKAEAAERCAVTAGEILDGLRDVARIGLAGQEVKSAEGVRMYTKYDLAAVNKALELLGKTIGMFKEDLGGAAGSAVIVAYPVNPKDGE